MTVEDDEFDEFLEWLEIRDADTDLCCAEGRDRLIAYGAGD